MKNISTLIIGLLLIGLSDIGMAQGLTNVIRFKMLNNNNNYSDETVIRFVPGAQIGFDMNYDAWKLFSPNPAAPALYTEAPNGYEFSISAYPQLNRDYEVELFHWVNLAENYTLSYEILGAFDPDVEILLEDMETSAVYNVFNDFPLNFNLPVNVDSAARFKVIFSLPAQELVIHEPCVDSTNGSLVVSKNGCTDWGYSLIDAGGNIVSTADNINESDTINGLVAGVYSLYSNAYSQNIEDSISFELDEVPGLTLNLTPTHVECNGGQTGSIDLEVLGVGAPFTFLWSTGQAGEDIEKISSGDYAVTVTNTYGCSSYDSIEVQQPEATGASFQIATGEERTYYIGETIEFANTSFNASEFVWDMGDTEISYKKDMTHQYEVEGEYQVVLHAGIEGCPMDTETALVQVIAAPVSTSVAEIPEDEPGFSVFSSANGIQIQSDEDIYSSIEVGVYDLRGSLITTQKLETLAGDGVYLEGTQHLSGMVIIRVSWSGHFTSFKYLANQL